MQETWARSLSREDTLEKEMANHSSTLAGSQALVSWLWLRPLPLGQRSLAFTAHLCLQACYLGNRGKARITGIVKLFPSALLHRPSEVAFKSLLLSEKFGAFPSKPHLVLFFHYLHHINLFISLITQPIIILVFKLFVDVSVSRLPQGRYVLNQS